MQILVSEVSNNYFRKQAEMWRQARNGILVSHLAHHFLIRSLFLNCVALGRANFTNDGRKFQGLKLLEIEV
jgi:hypothetical protein